MILPLQKATLLCGLLGRKVPNQLFEPLAKPFDWRRTAVETYDCIVHLTVLLAFWLDDFDGFLYSTKQNRHVPFFLKKNPNRQFFSSWSML
jgi:hypothetical protein